MLKIFLKKMSELTYKRDICNSMFFITIKINKNTFLYFYKLFRLYKVLLNIIYLYLQNKQMKIFNEKIDSILFTQK